MSRYRLILIRMALISVLMTLASGCATYSDRVTAIRSAFYRGRTGRALKLVSKEIRSSDEDANALILDRAILELADGRPSDAERSLREIRDRFDHLEQKDVRDTVFSTLGDDTSVEYGGEDYEKILIRCFLALSNLLHDGTDATAYALQVTAKQEQIIRDGVDEDGTNPKQSYRQVALGPYLHGVLREATHTDYDGASRSIQLVANWEPDLKFVQDDLDRVTNGRHSKPEHGVLYVFTLVGKGPYKEERAEVPTSQALLIADRILSATSKHSVPPTLAPIKVPVVIRARNEVTHIGTEVDGLSTVRTEPITHIGRMAVEQFDAVYPRIMARAVVRRVLKKSAIYATKEVAHIDDPVAGLALDAVGTLWEATESADTRCWGLLPDTIQVQRIELPTGEHDIHLTPQSGDQAMGDGVTHTVIIEDGRNTYMLANFPDSELAGRILVSNAPGP